jgi:hypothetical protein
MDQKVLEQLGQEIMLRKQCGNMSMAIDWFALAVLVGMLGGKKDAVFTKVPGE